MQFYTLYALPLDVGFRFLFFWCGNCELLGRSGGDVFFTRRHRVNRAIFVDTLSEFCYLHCDCKKTSRWTCDEHAWLSNSSGHFLEFEIMTISLSRKLWYLLQSKEKKIAGYIFLSL